MQTVVTELSPMGWLVAAQFLLYAAGWAVFALVLRENRSAFWQWGACMLLMGLGILLASQRGEPRAWAPYVGANLCFLAGFVALRRGVECFLGASPADREHATTLALFGAAYLWAGLDAQDSRWRVMLAYGAGAWIVGRTLVAVTPAFIREFGTRASWLLIVPGGLVMGLFALRVTQQLLDPEHNYEMHQKTASNQGLLFGYLLGAAMINFTFMGLAMLRKVGRLRDQARQDPLTGLFNRRVLDQAALAAWDRWKGGSEPFAALSLDLDFFKRVNDAHGHLAGDGLLKQVAWRLSAAVRKVDTVARTGGEEFVVLLPQVDRESALATAERLRAAIRAAPFELADGLWPMTISVGVALAHPGDAGPDVVLQRADLALYRAKAAGRDRVEFLA